MYSSDRSVDAIVQQGYTVKTGEYIQRGWEIMKQNLGGFIGITLLVFLIALFPTFLPQRLAPLFSFAANVVNGIVYAGLLIVAFKILKRQPTTFNDFFQGFNNFLPIFLTNLLVGLFVVLGFIALILPGIYLAVAYTFAIAFVVGRKFDFWEAMEASRRVVSKNWFSIFAFTLVLALLNFAGAILLGIGLLFTLPLTTCAIAAAFDDIVGLPASDNTFS